MDTGDFRKFVSGHPRIKTAEKLIIFPALDAFDRLASAQNCSRADLEPIVAAARDSHISVFDVGCIALRELAGTHPAAQEAILELSTSKKAQERFQIVAYLDRELPADLLRRVLSAAIVDKSGKVRSMAAQRCNSNDLKEFIPQLEQRLKDEPDAKVREVVSHQTRLLRDGYLVRTISGTTYLTIRMENGGTSSRYLTDEELRHGNFAELARLQQEKKSRRKT